MQLPVSFPGLNSRTWGITIWQFEEWSVFVKEFIKSFLAFATVITGVILIVLLFKDENYYYINGWICGILGIVLLAGGVTYFWTGNKFYKK